MAPWIKHLKEYGLLGKRDNVPSITIPVIERYVAGRAGGSYLVPLVSRSAWIAQRVSSIIHDLRSLERRIEFKKQASLFGPNSFPEADRLVNLGVVSSENDFVSFINVLNRCLVESIERFGQHQGQANYFWGLASTYPALHGALDRIKTYRNNVAHSFLLPQVEEKLVAYLSEDLEGRKPNDVPELWFVLQQRVLDSLFAAIQIETAQLN